MKTLHKTVSKAIAATAVAAAAAMIPAGVANATVLDSGSSSAILNSGAGSGIVGSGSYDSSTTSLNLQKDEPNGRARKTAGQEQQYDVHGDVNSAVVYQRFHVFGPEGKVFDGDAGGLTLPGAGAFWGTLFTNDLQRLYKDTVSFQYNAGGPYLNINFFDSSGSFLGHIQSGGVSTVVGVGGGSGSWHNA
uniref:Virulence associated protein A n=1 Tax=Rhodococcus hoagii TaxID=43767 RepID=A0A1W6I0Z2_RHOHA|nr:virulence associated protein A [Prescottella equi]